ncbi:unnamed protein product [Rodentolepis nana]|uniref:WW domain-containing protein n=1 Tax=Rodentolepis nana TaxID=102285 RepID=A0A0R3TNV8_RODNA|nr:unnamed protein product [Rodentolepis nana]
MRTVQKQPKSATVEQFLAPLEKEESTELWNKWQEVRGLISERVPILQNLCENHDLFVNQIERFEKLMSDMFDYLESVAQAANSQSSAIEAQLGESVEALRDMEKMQPTLGHLDGIVKELQYFFNEAYLKKLKTRLQELNQTWNRVKELTNENIEFLRSKLETSSSAKDFVEEEKSEAQPSDSATAYHSEMQEAPITINSGLPQNHPPDTVVKMIDLEELQKWISKAKHRFAKFTSINSREEVDKFEEFLEQFRSEIDVRRPMIEAMRSGEARDAMGKSISSKTVLLFSGHFADLESEYAASQERLKSATYHFNDFNSLMSYEKHWLERVDSMLKKSKNQTYVDVGDICDEIMASYFRAFDNLKSEHSEDDFARLKKIVRLLSSEKVMSQKLNAEFETYAASIASALQQLIRRLDELKKLKQRTEDTQNQLDRYSAWLRDTTKNIQEKMRIGGTVASSKELDDFCSQITEIDESIASIRHDIDKRSSTESLANAVPESLTEKLNLLQTDTANFKRALLLYTFPSNIQSSIIRSREATREHDVAAVNLEVVSLTNDHIISLLKKADDLIERIRETQNLVDSLQNTVSSTKPLSELRNTLDELLHELKDLFNKNTKILEHVERFREGLQDLQPHADQYSKIIDPLDQVMMNVEEVTDYLETADTNHSHIEMLQRVLNELCGVLGREDRDQDDSSKEDENSTVEKLENLLRQIEISVDPIEGLNSTIANVRRIIDKAFAARNAFRAQINGLATESNESSVTEATEIRVVPETGTDVHESTLKSTGENNRGAVSDETNQSLLSVIYARSNQLTTEISEFFQDLDNFNKYCVKLDPAEKSPEENDSLEPLQTTMAKCEKKVEYFKLQSHYLESRLSELLKASKALQPDDRKIVLKVQKFWTDSKKNLAWHLEEINQLSRTLKEAQEAFSNYERYPAEGNRQICLTYITRLEDSYNWRLNQDRACLDKGYHAEIAQRLSSSTRSTNFIFKLTPFRECLQQFVTQLNEIQDELYSCQSIPTHELLSQIQNLDQYFTLAQEAASKATSILNRCRMDQVPEKESNGENNGSENEFLASTNWLEAILETQKGRLNTYCNEFHLCRPYWQEYGNLWQSFMNESIMQKHQMELLQLDRIPNEDHGSSEASVGTARDYAVNLCSSVLTLQRLGSKIVWKAQYSQIGHGLKSDLYLQPVFDERFSNRPLRMDNTLQDDITFINETFDTLVEELKRLSQKYNIESLVPPNLRIDTSRIEDLQVQKSDSLSDMDGFQETTFPQSQRQQFESVGITSFEACLNRLNEELAWLKQSNLYIPVVDVPSNYISKLDSEFWSPTGATGSVQLCSNWIKSKSTELSKLDSGLKMHEKRSAQLCTTSEKLSATLEDFESRRQLHEAADELHASMEAARGVIDRRRTRLSVWLSVCSAIESAMLMDGAGSVIDQGGQQTLPVWIATIRKRLEQSSSNLDSPVFKKELNRPGDDSHEFRSLYPPVIQIQLQQYAIELEARKPQLDKLIIETQRLEEELRHTDNNYADHLSTMTGNFATCCTLPHANMSSYLTSSLVHVVSSIKRTVNEFVGETSGTGDIEKGSNAVNGKHSTGGVDFIQSRSRRGSISDSSNCNSPSPHANDPQEPPRRLSLAEIFGNTGETIKDQMPSLSELESPKHSPILHQKEPCSPRQTSKIIQRMPISENSVRWKPPSLPSLSTLLEEDTEKSSESFSQNVCSSSSESDHESSSKKHLEEFHAPTPQIEVQESSSLEHAVDAVVEEVRQCWNETSSQVKARLDELEKMMTATDELKTLERELDRWLSRAESNLEDAISNTQDIGERKRIIQSSLEISYNSTILFQEIIDRLPDGETKFTLHQNKCEAILEKYSKEDTQKFRSDQEAIQLRWSQLVTSLRESLEGAAQLDPDLIEIPVAAQPKRPESDLQRIVRLRTATSQQPGACNSGDLIRPMESRSMETSVIDAFGNGDANPPRTYGTMGHRGYGQKFESVSHPPAWRGLVMELVERGFMCLNPNNVYLIEEAGSSQRLPNENWRLFLAQLRQTNDWLAHQDANFHQLKGTIGGDSESVSQLINSFSILEDEIRQHKFQVDELLNRGKIFMQDQTIDGRYCLNMDSEGDSDGSEYEPGKVDVDESNMSTKRIKLTVFERVLDDAENELKSAQKLLMSQDLSSPTNDQKLQMIWDTCASVTHAIAGLDGQALCLSDDGTIISHVLISRLDGLKIGLERLRSLTNEEMNRSSSINGLSSTLSQPIAPVFQRNLRSPPQHMLNSESTNTPLNDGALIPRPKSPSECWLQAFKTVSYPWERCLLPAGNQVPYYKNHATQETQWDHPLMIELLQKMDESNTIRFQAYRAAAKIRQLQLRLFCELKLQHFDQLRDLHQLDQVPLNVATETFARHGLTSPLYSEGYDGRMMDVPQMLNCLTTLYCRLWDLLVSQPDVVKITNASGDSQMVVPTQQTPSRSHNSDSIAVGNKVQQIVT